MHRFFFSSHRVWCGLQVWCDNHGIGESKLAASSSSFPFASSLQGPLLRIMSFHPALSSASSLLFSLSRRLISLEWPPGGFEFVLPSVGWFFQFSNNFLDCRCRCTRSTLSSHWSCHAVTFRQISEKSPATRPAIPSTVIYTFLKTSQTLSPDWDGYVWTKCALYGYATAFFIFIVTNTTLVWSGRQHS